MEYARPPENYSRIWNQGLAMLLSTGCVAPPAGSSGRALLCCINIGGNKQAWQVHRPAKACLIVMFGYNSIYPNEF
jgi:hypothetical protein